MSKHWSLAEVWNSAFEKVEEPPVKPRSYLYASELGSPFIETYYKMAGIPYTNTFTAANRRKMEAGRLFEGIVRFVLKRAGILHRSQQNADYQLSGMLEVHGRLDFVAGGKVDLAQVKECQVLAKILFTELEFPQIYLDIADRTFEMVQQLAGKKREGLQVYVLELKSVSDFVFRLIENNPRPMNYHHLQTFHYLLALEMVMGKIAYINRDDVRIIEKKVLNNSDSRIEYETWIGQMTEYNRSPTPPDKEPLIVFYRDTCGFNKNTIGVEWSKYLTLIYGFESADAYRNYIKPIVDRYNRVYQRCVECQKMTDDNKLAIGNAKKLFPDWDRLVDLGKLRKIKMEGLKGEAV